MRDLILTGTILVLLCFVPRRPWFGVIILAWLGYMNAHRACYGFAYTAPFVLIVALATLASMAFSRTPLRLPWCRENLVLLAFIVWMNVTFQFALNPAGARWEWDRCMKIQLLVFITMVLIDTRQKVNALVWTIVISLGFYGVKGGLFAIATGGHYRVQGPAYTFIEDNNHLALALVMTIPLMRYLQLVVESAIARVALSGAILLTSLAILSSYSRAGFLALLVVGGFMVMKSRKRILFGTMMAAGLYVMYGFMPAEWHGRMQSIDEYEMDPSARGRINAWEFALNLAAAHPLVGGGFKTFTPELFRIYAPQPENHHDAHSIYLQVLGEQGYPGLLLFLTLGFLTWRSATRVRKIARQRPRLKWIADLMSMTQVSLVGYAVGGAFVTLAYFDLPYHLMTLVVIAKALAMRELAGEREAVTAPAASMTEAMAHG